MSNAAIASINLSDAGTVSASGFITLAPPSLLQNVHVGKKWRQNAPGGDTAFVLADLGTSKSIDTVMLAGLGSPALDNSTVFNVKYSSVDSTGVAGDVFNSGAIVGLPYFDLNYAMFVHLKPTPASCRYVRIDFARTGFSASYVEAGRLFVGLRNTFTTNNQTPWKRTAMHESILTDGVGGQTFTDVRPGRWTTAASFEFVTDTERNTWIEQMGVTLIAAGRVDMLWIMDPDSLNLSRDCLWGMLDGDLSSTQNIYIIPPLYGVEFPLRQRL